ncbi:hypothetical protein [Nonomuraea typhae]|uniref:hypothetical protein n=1 Tax=Nonomuraea typhae TaxID=2603600 RepID=UPI0012FA4F1C|nr:hypothetical protein [Nonomuraea typhae]
MPRSTTALSLLAVTTAASLLTSGNAEAAAAEPPLTAAVFRATHNSYSGNLGGARGPISQQLDAGIRFVEYDIHDNGFTSRGDYALGHDAPGDEVDHAGNPASGNLGDWLRTVGTWSAAHPQAAPIVVALDVKDNLTDNANHAEGNLAALNDRLTSAFGERLFRASDYRPAGPPTVGQLRGRILAVLSGDGRTRTLYRRDTGYNPAIALNNRGQVVEVHDSGNGTLWYWTGRYGSDGRVSWLRHGRYDTGENPAVAMNDNGDVVEVHESENTDALWYRVGRLDAATGEIRWSAGRQYDRGVRPTIRFTGQARLREIHQSQSGGQNWDWDGVLGDMAVSWSGNGKTADPRYDKTTSAAGASWVRVRTAADRATPAETLRVDTDRVTGDLIRYQQVAFHEFQKGNSAELQQDALFYAAPASESAFITGARQAGKLVRGWGFNSAADATTPIAGYPATDTPYASWYVQVLDRSGAVS